MGPSDAKFETAYQGHLPNGEGVQKHSAGDIYPVIIVHYGDGTSRWVDQRLGRASTRRMRNNPRWTIHDYAAAYATDRHTAIWPVAFSRNYQDFLKEFHHV